MKSQTSGKFRGSDATSVFVAVLLIILIFVLYYFGLTGSLKRYLESHIHPVVFIALMAVLPMLGVPINIFLVLVGMQFGIVGGTLLSAVLMSLQMAITFYLVHSILRERISRLLQQFDVSMPDFGENQGRWQVIIFMLIPGIPYTVKNTLLALAGYPFTPYMTINFLTQYGMGLPLIILGGAVIEMDTTVTAVAVILLLICYVVQWYVRKIFAAKNEGKRDEDGH